MEVIPAIAPQVAWQILEEEAILIDLATGATLGLNPTGTYIWSQIGGRPEEQIAASTAEQFDVDADTAASDVREFLAMLRARNLIVDAGEVQP